MEQQKTAAVVESIHLSSYISVLRERKLLIISCVIITVFVVMFRTFLMKPVYSAAAVLVIDKENRNTPITGGEIDVGSYQDQLLTFNTHFKLIKSKPVIEEVIHELKLDQQKSALDPTSFSGRLQYYKDNIKLMLQMDKVVPSEQDRMGQLIQSVGGMVNIKSTRETRLMTIAVNNTNAELASRIANAIGSKYIEFDYTSRLDSSQKNISFMNQEMYELKKKVEDDEQAFLEYKRSKNVFSYEGKQKVIDQNITELNNEFLITKNKRRALDAKILEIEKQMSSSAEIFHNRSILSNTMIDGLYATLTNLEMEANKIGEVYKSRHPKIIQINSEIAKAKDKLRTELRKEVDNIESERSVLLAREEIVAKNIEDYERDALTTGGQEIHYAFLQRNLKTSQALYDTVLARIKESQINTSGLPTSNIRIVEQATVPLSPIGPNKLKNLLLSIVVGCFGGVGLAFFSTYLDRSIRTEDDIEMYLQMPLLAVIPLGDENDTHGKNS